MSFFIQIGGNDLAGLTFEKRLSLDRTGAARLRIVCREKEEMAPGGNLPIVPNGNWTLGVELTLRCKIKAVTGAIHDQYSGRIADLMLDRDLVTDLNNIALDNELQIMRVRLGPGTNDVDDSTKEYVSTWELIADVVPHVTSAA